MGELFHHAAEWAALISRSVCQRDEFFDRGLLLRLAGHTPFTATSLIDRLWLLYALPTTRWASSQHPVWDCRTREAPGSPGDELVTTGEDKGASYEISPPGWEQWRSTARTPSSSTLPIYGPLRSLYSEDQCGHRKSLGPEGDSRTDTDSNCSQRHSCPYMGGKASLKQEPRRKQTRPSKVISSAWAGTRCGHMTTPTVRVTAEEVQVRATA